MLQYIRIWCNKHLTQRQFILLLSFIVGLGSACAAQSLKWLIHTIESLLTHGFDTTNANYLYLVYPVVGIFLTALFIRYIVRDDIGHGVTKILYAISKNRGFIKKHNCFTSVIASAITIGCGGSVGAESPIVLTGSAIGSTLGKAFQLDHKTLMLLIGCGASGAVAGIFKAPIAGLMFTLEVLMIDLTMASLMPLLVSCITATCLTYLLSGDMQALFPFSLKIPFSVDHVPTVILLGLGCGLLSLYFTKAMNAFEKFFAAHCKTMFSRLLLGGSVLAWLIYLFPPLYGEGYSTITLLLNSNQSADVNQVLNNSFFYGHSNMLLVYLTLIVLTKVFATTATNGGGGCGGTFAPSLFLGCIAGFVFAQLWNQYGFWDVSTPEENYALLGMAGVMAGVFHAPLTGVFLIAELTGGYDLFIPLMIVSGCAYLTIRAFEPHSIYAMRLARRGQLLTHDKDSAVLTLMSLEEVIVRNTPTFTPDMTLGKMVSIISGERSDVFAVIDKENHLLGVVGLRSIRKVVFRSELYREYVAEQLMHTPTILLSTDVPMQVVIEKLEQTPFSTLPVLNSDGTFSGFVSRTKFYAHYRQIMKDFSEE